MRKIICILIAAAFMLTAFTGCSSVYEKGVDYPEYPEKYLPVYDDAVVFYYKEKDGEWRIKYGTEDDVDDVADFYKDLFEDEDYTVTDEKEEKDSYSAEGMIKDYAFEIEAEEASGEEAEFFDTVVDITVEETDIKKGEEPQKDGDIKNNDTQAPPSQSDIAIVNSVSALAPAQGTGSIGGLDEYNVEAQFDSTAFPVASNLSISMAQSSDFPEPDPTRFEVGETGFDFSIGGADYYRPNEPVTVTFKLEESVSSELEDESFFAVAYYFKGQWYLQTADSVDLEKGTAQMSLYHFSWLFPAKLTKEEIRDLKAEELAEIKFNDGNNLSKIKHGGQSDLEKVISEATGVTDAKALTAIAEYMLNEEDLTNLMLAGSKGDYTAYSTKMAEMVAKKINSAAVIGDNATMIAGAFQAAGYIWEGDAQGAAEAVANAMLDSTAYGKLMKLAVKVTDETIKSWKANGIEEMYQAYKNGAEEGWFGYNVEKGDFNTALEQSSAIERQIAIDAVKSYLNTHGGKESDLSAAKLEEIKQDAISALEQKFKDRVAQEAQIAKDKDYYKKLLDAFEENGVDDSVTIKVDLIDELTYEQRLESYVRVTDRIIKMAGGRKIEFDGLVDDTEIPAHVITSAIKMWYGEDGENKVKEYLAEQGYIEPFKATDLDGVWTGTMTYTEVSMDEDMIRAMVESLPEESDIGCDKAAAEAAFASMTEMEGTSEEVSYKVWASGNVVYMMKSDDDGAQVMTFSFNEKTGVLTLVSVTGADDNYSSAMSLTVADTQPLTISGAMSVTSKEQTQDDVTLPAGAIKITAAVNLVKTG